MDGLLIIDKELGLTSNDVVRKVRRLLGQRRVGHCGTLDPLATGVLPVAVGRATRLVEFLMEGEKTYRATLKLGEITATQDAEGEVLERCDWTCVTESAIRAAAATLVGPIAQIPPMYSALKRDGVPLYKLARQGVEVVREARAVTIFRLDILAIDLPFVTIEVDCSKGTYIRTLAHDLGQLLGCGAHLTALRRTRNGRFSEDQSITLTALEAQLKSGGTPPLFDLFAAMSGVAQCSLTAAAAQRLSDGVPPEHSGLAAPVTVAAGEMVLLTYAGQMLAIVRYAPGREREARGDFELLRVFLPQHETE
jgi:tRNA pseudouridine55 synthase